MLGFGAYHTAPPAACPNHKFFIIFLVNRCLILYIWQCAHIVMYASVDQDWSQAGHLISIFSDTCFSYLRCGTYVATLFFIHWGIKSVLEASGKVKLPSLDERKSLLLSLPASRTKIIGLWLSLCDTEAGHENVKANFYWREQKGSKEQALVELPDQTWINLTVSILESNKCLYNVKVREYWGVLLFEAIFILTGIPRLEHNNQHLKILHDMQSVAIERGYSSSFFLSK